MNEELKKQEKLYAKLGARKFQKVVFFIEEKKWNFIKKYVPNYLKYVEENIDKKREAEEINRKINEYNNAFAIINETITKEKDIPDQDKLVSTIKKKEQAIELKNFLLEMQRERAKQQNIKNEKQKEKK